MAAHVHLASLASGTQLLGVFVAPQTRTSAPNIDPNRFASHNWRRADTAALVLGATFSAPLLASILFLTQVSDGRSSQRVWAWPPAHCWSRPSPRSPPSSVVD